MPLTEMCGFRGKLKVKCLIVLWKKLNCFVALATMLLARLLMEGEVEIPAMWSNLLAPDGEECGCEVDGDSCT